MKKTVYSMAYAAVFAAGCTASRPHEDCIPLQAPSDVAVERIDDNTVNISWKDNSEGENGFSVWLKEYDDGQEARRIGFTVEDISSYTVRSGLAPGRSYYFGVRADGRSSKDNSETVYSPLFYFEDFSLPGMAFIGNPIETQSCIAFRYKLRNTGVGASCGICWSADKIPTLEDSYQTAPAFSGGEEEILQVIPNILLDYDTKYNFRGYVRTGTDIHYSAVIRAGLSAELQAIEVNWTKQDTSTIPAAISVFTTTDPLGGHSFNAWYAIADVGSGSVELRVNVPEGVATIDDQSASFGGDCFVLVNGGYFYDTSHVGLAVVNSSQIGYIPDVRGSLRAGHPEYDEMYHVTRGIFGVDGNGVAAVYWAGSNGRGGNFYYDRPLPSVRGEARHGGVTANNPAAHIGWEPRYAVSAGPVLLKDGKCPFDFTETEKGEEYYLNNYELIPYDIFGPAESPDRTAVGYTADGKVVLFVCDGRIARSGGATLTELAMILKGIGCVDAVNLDGGGSTGMMVGMDHVNYHGDGNRAVKSTIGFFRKE